MRLFQLFLMFLLAFVVGCGKSANNDKKLAAASKSQLSGDELCGNTFFSQFRNHPEQLKITLTKDWIAGPQTNDIHVVVDNGTKTVVNTPAPATNPNPAPAAANAAPTPAPATSAKVITTSLFVGDNCWAESSVQGSEHMQSDEVIAKGTVLSPSRDAGKGPSSVIKNGLEVWLYFPENGPDAQRIKNIYCDMEYQPNEDFRLSKLKAVLERDGSMQTNISSDPKCKQ